MTMKAASAETKTKSRKDFPRSATKLQSSAARLTAPDATSEKKSPAAKSNAAAARRLPKKNNNLKNFYIFRHGECPLNVTGHIQGQSIDGGLTANGRRQIHITGQLLRDKNIDIIISSPLKRARQSARIVSLYVNRPILLDERLKEVNMGVVEGMHVDEVTAKFPDLYAKWQNCSLNDKSTHFENGETKAEVRQRIFAALADYAEKTSYHNIAISAHGITISQALLVFNVKRSNIPNGSVLHLSYHNHHWKYLGFIENTLPRQPRHLPPRLHAKPKISVRPFIIGEHHA